MSSVDIEKELSRDQLQEENKALENVIKTPEVEGEMAETKACESEIMTPSELKGKIRHAGRSHENEGKMDHHQCIHLLEVCCDNITSAFNAAEGGADRIELCGALEVGGITPSAGMVKMVKKYVGIPVFMMIRPRSGNFTYTNIEVMQMLEDIRIGVALKVDGFVFGAIRDGKVDKNVCRRLIAETQGLQLTFHRAFDTISDENALQDVIDCGFHRVLTSGKAPTAYEGMETIKKLVEEAGSRIIIMAGSGINEKNLSQIMAYTNAKEFHTSAQLPSPTIPEEPSAPIVKGACSYAICSTAVTEAIHSIMKVRPIVG